MLVGNSAAARVRGSSAVRLCRAVPRRSGRAKPPAPGAPGAVHRWAPADKHGFGTAHQLDSKAWFTLRQGSLSEIYYPNLTDCRRPIPVSRSILRRTSA